MVPYGITQGDYSLLLEEISRMFMQLFRRTRQYRFLVAGILLLSLAACGNDGSMEHTTAPTSASGTTGIATAQPTMTAGGSAPGMNHGGMSMTEAQFIDGMIAHHQGAITMATEATTAATRPEVKQLAQTIVAAQDPEIKQLQGWRTQWYPNEAQTDATMMESMGMGDMMIAQDASKDFDQRFLEAMISHHQGAVQMAETIKGTATHPELRTFAEKVITDQTAEITQMESWLREWYTK